MFSLMVHASYDYFSYGSYDYFKKKLHKLHNPLTARYNKNKMIKSITIFSL